MSELPPYPILEFDEAREAVIEPGKLLRPSGFPPHCVLCFFRDVLDRLAATHGAVEVGRLGSECGPSPIYRLEMEGAPINVAHPGVGAPFAAAVREELIAYGCNRFIACGGAGVLRRDLAVGQVVVPTAAVRDEGTSYHYMPPSREVAAQPEVLASIERTLQAEGVPYIVGKTWTTDAFYRETPARVARRRAEGCLTVEMETAAFLAVAAFRGIQFGQLLYGGDDVSGTEWDARHGQHRGSAREALFGLAVRACLAL